VRPTEGNEEGNEIRGPRRQWHRGERRRKWQHLGDERFRRPRRKWATEIKFRGPRRKWATENFVAHFILRPRNSLPVAHFLLGRRKISSPKLSSGPRISFPWPISGACAMKFFVAQYYIWASIYKFRRPNFGLRHSDVEFATILFRRPECRTSKISHWAAILSVAQDVFPCSAHLIMSEDYKVT